MLRWFWHGLAMYGAAHFGRGPVEGLDFYHKSEKSKKNDSGNAQQPPAVSPSDGDSQKGLAKSEKN